MRRVTTVLLAVVLAVMLAGPAGASQQAAGYVQCGPWGNPYVQSYSIGWTEHFAPGGWNYMVYDNPVWTVRQTASGYGTGGGDWYVGVIGTGSLDVGSTVGGCA